MAKTQFKLRQSGLAIESVADGLGCEFELPGSLWVLLISWAALRAGGLPKGLNYIGVVMGVAGILTVVPAAREVARAVFGLGQLVWFMWRKNRTRSCDAILLVVVGLMVLVWFIARRERRRKAA